MWELFWDEKYKRVHDNFKQFGLKHQQSVRECDKDILPASLWADLCASGIYEYGMDDGIVCLAAALEGLCYGIRGINGANVSLASHLSMGVSVIHNHTTGQLREKMFSKIINQREIVAFAAAEPHGGSDAQKLETHVVRDGDFYILNGEKWHITNAPYAGIIVTFAREAETNATVAMVLEKGWKGLNVTQLSPVGLKLCPIGKISLNNVKVPIENIIGEVGKGLDILYDGFTRERVLLPFIAAGMLRRELDEAFAHTQNRNIFNDKIGNYQYIKYRLTEMKVAIDTIQSLGHAVLKQFFMKKNVLGMASEVKMYAANQTINVIQHAIKIFGSYGLQEGSVGSLLTTAIGSSIAGGTEEVHRELMYQDMYINYYRLLKGQKYL